jgi:hypothetical protein
MNGLRILDPGAAGWLIDDFISASFAAAYGCSQPRCTDRLRLVTMIVRGFASRLPGLFAQVTLPPILGIPGSVPGYADRNGETDLLGAGGLRCQARAEGVTRWQVT